MCGIFGYFDVNQKSISKQKLEKMGNTLHHRGPDDTGLFYDEKKAVALGNKRLSILDIDHGHQPFVSDDNNIIVVQNGEIFNHVELAAMLRKDNIICKTHNDTEVILRMYEKYGIDCVSKFNGMFAIAIYDQKIDSLFLVRDRVGEKPLFLLNDRGTISFASEIKAILELSGKRDINYQALNQFFALNYVPVPLTMFDGIEHVMPGHYVKITREKTENICWWDLSKIQEQQYTENEAIEKFNTILDNAVKIRLRADVPFGAFLSGGIDSSTVVGMMSKHMSNPVNTFSIGFDDPKYDETIFAQEASRLFGTEHVFEKIDPNTIDLWPFVTEYTEQPHGDVSFIPTYKVAELASKKVKMVLTGDGADELFAGYDKYKNFFNKSNIKSLSDLDFKKQYINGISLFLQNDRAKLMSPVLEKINNIDIYNFINPLFEKAKNMDRINQALYIDTMLLLSGNNLVKPDRMGMAVSIENRAPFLDYRMIEFAFSLNGNLKLKDGITKNIYKKAVCPLIGDNLAYRKKQMFTVPIGDWFKTHLKDFCYDLLLSKSSISQELFDINYVKQLLDGHCNNTFNKTREIRALLSFEIWFNKFMRLNQ